MTSGHPCSAVQDRADPLLPMPSRNAAIFPAASPESGSSCVREVVEAKGFEEEFEDLFATAFRVTRRLVGSTCDAEDGAAEAVARALVSWRRLSGQSYRHAWVARVAANAAIDQ